MYEKVASNLKGQVGVGKCDATDNRGLAGRFDVAGYPAIYLVRGSEVWKYTGPRTTTGFVQFATQGYKTAAAISYFKSPMGIV